MAENESAANAELADEDQVADIRRARRVAEELASSETIRAVREDLKSLHDRSIAALLSVNPADAAKVAELQQMASLHIRFEETIKAVQAQAENAERSLTQPDYPDR